VNYYGVKNGNLATELCINRPAETSSSGLKWCEQVCMLQSFTPETNAHIFKQFHKNNTANTQNAGTDHRSIEGQVACNIKLLAQDLMLNRVDADALGLTGGQ